MNLFVLFLFIGNSAGDFDEKNAANSESKFFLTSKRKACVLATKINKPTFFACLNINKMSPTATIPMS